VTDVAFLLSLESHKIDLLVVSHSGLLIKNFVIRILMCHANTTDNHLLQVTSFVRDVEAAQQ